MESYERGVKKSVGVRDMRGIRDRNTKVHWVGNSVNPES